MIRETDTFGRWLRRRLAELDLKVPAFAKQIIVSRASVYAWLNDQKPPAAVKYDALGLILGADPSAVAGLVKRTRRSITRRRSRAVHAPQPAPKGAA